MAQGTSSEDKVRYEILSFLSNGQAKTEEIFKHCTAAKPTFYKYLNALYDDKFLVWKPERGRGNDTYELSKEGKLELKKLEIISENAETIHSMTNERLLNWLSAKNRMLSEAVLINREGIYVFGNIQDDAKKGPLIFNGPMVSDCWFPRSNSSSQQMILTQEESGAEELTNLEEYFKTSLYPALKETGYFELYDSLRKYVSELAMRGNWSIHRIESMGRTPKDYFMRWYEFRISPIGTLKQNNTFETKTKQ